VENLACEEDLKRKDDTPYSNACTNFPSQNKCQSIAPRCNVRGRKGLTFSRGWEVDGGITLNIGKEEKGGRGREPFLSLAQEKKISEVLYGKQSTIIGALKEN
jgi:hypothetical protein